MQEKMFVPDPITQVTEGDIAVYRYFPKQIRVVGVGGAGCNIINYLYSLGAFGSHMIAVDTDEKRLSVIRADERFLIGKSVAKESGTHGDVDMGRLSAEKSGWKLEEAFKGTKLMFIAWRHGRRYGYRCAAGDSAAGAGHGRRRGRHRHSAIH